MVSNDANYFNQPLPMINTEIQPHLYSHIVIHMFMHQHALNKNKLTKASSHLSSSVECHRSCYDDNATTLTHINLLRFLS